MNLQHLISVYLYTELHVIIHDIPVQTNNYTYLLYRGNILYIVKQYLIYIIYIINYNNRARTNPFQFIPHTLFNTWSRYLNWNIMYFNVYSCFFHGFFFKFFFLPRAGTVYNILFWRVCGSAYGTHFRREKKFTSGVTREHTQAHTCRRIFKDRPRKSSRTVYAHISPTISSYYYYNIMWRDGDYDFIFLFSQNDKPYVSLIFYIIII